jgi:hypothetical protein
MHIGGGAGGVSIGEAWDAWSWLQVGREWPIDERPVKQ